MGVFSKIVDKVKDVIGDVVDGVIDFVDDVIGVDLRKVLNNKWVKYALMAASIFTGGVAIMNGVIQGAGAVGAAKGFMGKFVEGAVGFVKGVASGIMNPMETAGNLVGEGSKLLSGDFANMANQVAGKGDVVAGGAQDLLSNANEGADMAANLTDGMVDEALGAVQPDFGIPTPNQPGGLTDSMVDSALGATQPDFGAPTTNMPGGSGHIAEQAVGVTPAPPEEGGFLSKMAGAAKDYATSPGGMKTIAGAAQGWAKGQAEAEQLKEIRKREERRRGSWAGFGDRTNSILSGQPLSLQELRERSMSVRNRGNQAQAKYGY